jgi:hypothetical protein
MTHLSKIFHKFSSRKAILVYWGVTLIYLSSFLV